MATYQRVTHLAADRIEVRELTLNGEVIDFTPAEVEEHEPAPAFPTPIAPYPMALPEKLTMAALRDRQEYLLGVLVQAGIISSNQYHPANPTDGPESAPEGSEAPAATGAPADPAQATPQAVAAGVVDGA